MSEVQSGFRRVRAALRGAGEACWKGRHRGRWWALVVWLCLIVLWVTWTPLQRSPERNPVILFPPTEPFELIGNVLLLMPIGAAVALGTLRRRILFGSLVAFGLSFLVEAGQIFLMGRIVSATDLLLNTAGGAVGAAVAVGLCRLVDPWKLLNLICGVIFAGVAVFSILGGGIFRTALRLSGWDPDYEIVAGDEVDGTRTFQGQVEDARICAGRSTDQVCAGPGSPADLRRRLTAAAEQSQHLDIYADVVSATNDQWGPTRIVTFSQGRFRRNVTLGVEGAALVLRTRTPLMGPNGFDWQIWIPEAIQVGEPAAIHVRFDRGNVRTTIASKSRTRVARHRFDVLSSGMLLTPPQEVTPLQVRWIRLLGFLILAIPPSIVVLTGIVRRMSRNGVSSSSPRRRGE